MDDYHTRYPRLAAQWLHGLALLAIVCWFSPISINIAVGQDGVTTIAVTSPEADAKPPAPPVVQPPPLQESSAAVAESTVSQTHDATDEETTTTAEVSTESELLGSENETTDILAPSSSTDSVRRLSVEPGTRPVLPADRPAWIDAAPDYSGSVHRLYVGSLPAFEESEADRALDEPLMAAVNEYIDTQILGQPGAAYALELDENYIRKNLVNAPGGYTMQLNTTNGPMYQKWVTLEVTPEQRKQIKVWHHEALQRSRLEPLGVGLVAIIGLVGVSHLLLRRRHAPATAQPLRPEQLLADAAAPQAPPKRSGLSFLAVTACVLLLPMLLFAALFTVRMVDRPRMEAIDVHPVPVPRQTVLSHELTGVPVPPAPPAMIPMDDLHDSENVETLETNGQVIIIRKSGS